MQDQSDVEVAVRLLSIVSTRHAVLGECCVASCLTDGLCCSTHFRFFACDEYDFWSSLRYLYVLADNSIESTSSLTDPSMTDSVIISAIKPSRLSLREGR